MNVLIFSYQMNPFHTSELAGRYAMVHWILLATALLLVPALAHAQTFDRIEERSSNVPSYFYHVQPGEATMQVEVLGAVRSPGLYVLDANTTLNELLALSGGPTLNVRTGSNRRTTIVRLMRPQRENDPVFEAQLEGAIASFDDAPPLADGDILNVEIIERRRFTWRDVFTVVNTVALIALSVERLSDL